MIALDISSLQSGIDGTITDIEALRAQNSTIQRAVNDFSSLDEALKGEGGNAIRAFFKDCHLPFLIMFHQSMTDYKNVLEELKKDRKSTRLNSSHVAISYAVFCL